MPINAASEERKAVIKRLVEQRLGELDRPHGNKHDWYCSHDDSVHVFITDSKGSYDYAPFYDMAPNDVDDLARQKSGFVIFILGGSDKYLVIPAEELRVKLSRHSSGLNAEGRYLFHKPRGTTEFRELEGWSLLPYLNRINLLPEMKTSDVVPNQTPDLP